jgi:hypothetical protein
MKTSEMKRGQIIQLSDYNPIPGGTADGEIFPTTYQYLEDTNWTYFAVITRTQNGISWDLLLPDGEIISENTDPALIDGEDEDGGMDEYISLVKDVE